MSFSRPKQGPPILLSRPELPRLEDYVARLGPIWESRYLSNRGPLVRELEDRLQALLGAPQLSMVASGTLALELALMAAGAKGEVITTPLSFVASTNSIVRAGAKPRFVDIEPLRMTIDVAQVEDAIGPDTSAILAVHVFGQACDVEALEDVAARHGLPLLYDAAHAFGMVAKGRPIAAWGDYNAFSLHATKPFHTAEGGIVTTRTADAKTRVDRMSNHGLDADGLVREQATNAKMNELSAALGLSMIADISARTAARAAIARRYSERLGNIPGIVLPTPPQEGTETNHSYYVIRIEPDAFGATAAQARDELATFGIMARRYFHPSLHQMPAFDTGLTLPEAERASDEVMALPIYSSLTDDELDRVCDAIAWLPHHFASSRV